MHACMHAIIDIDDTNVYFQSTIQPVLKLPTVTHVQTLAHSVMSALMPLSYHWTGIPA